MWRVAVGQEKANRMGVAATKIWRPFVSFFFHLHLVHAQKSIIFFFASDENEKKEEKKKISTTYINFFLLILSLVYFLSSSTCDFILDTFPPAEKENETPVGSATTQSRHLLVKLRALSIQTIKHLFKITNRFA